MQNLLTVRVQLHGEQKLDNTDESCEMKDKAHHDGGWSKVSQWK
jgi:hypothetical protein